MKSLLIVASIALVIAGCSVRTGLNKECNFRKKTADGGVVLITEGELQESLTGGGSSTRDFIAKGAVECDDFWCVRDSSFPKGTDMAAPAFGYCSQLCQQGLECLSDDPALDLNAKTRMSCRVLLLNKEVLAQLPELGAKEPYLCARGQADAGVGK